MESTIINVFQEEKFNYLLVFVFLIGYWFVIEVINVKDYACVVVFEKKYNWLAGHSSYNLLKMFNTQFIQIHVSQSMVNYSSLL